jgi:hypothetical protein
MTHTFESPADLELAHYGVKGMRWGIRKDRESGGGRGRTSATRRSKTIKRETNAEIRGLKKENKVLKSLADKEQQKIDNGASFVSRKISEQKLKKLNSQISKNDKKADDLKKHGKRFTITEKQVMIATAAAVAVGAAYLAYRYGSFDQERTAAMYRTHLSNLKFGSPFKPNSKLSRPMSVDEIMKNIVSGTNPNYASSGGQMNCRRTTFAYELRRRGFDVAATTSAIGYGQSESGLRNALSKKGRNLYSSISLSTMTVFGGGPLNSPAVGDRRKFPEATRFSSSIRDLPSKLSTLAEGARGEAVFEMDGFSHSMAFEIIQGEPHIFDTQKGTHYPATPEGLDELEHKWGKAAGVHLTRLDNLDLDLQFLSRWVENK